MKRFIRWGVWMASLSLIVTVSYAQYTSGQTIIGSYVSGVKLIGGNTDASIVNYATGISLKYVFSEFFIGEITAGLGWVRPRDPNSYFKNHPNAPYKTYIYPWSLNFRFNMLQEQRVIPYVGIGAGLTHWNLRDISGKDKWFPFPASGTSISGNQTNFTGLGILGTSIFLSENFGLDFEIRYSHLFGQGEDNIGTGDINTGIIEVRLGLDIIFGGFRDSDHDGIEDKYDVYPYQPEDYDGFQDEDGAPDLDNDNDGIPDDKDLAPNLAEDIDGFQDEDGVPDLDNDNDGIPDVKDQCPNEPEDFDKFQDEDGCPDPDNDNDGIPDALDQCPDKPETFNNYQDEDGCPDEKPQLVLPEAGKELILQGVTFATGKATLTENAKKVLDIVCESLKNNPEVFLEIRGFTDNTGSAVTNLNLSQARAESVRDYFVENGIASDRLRAIGYGEANPIASNNTEEGRAKNRRIEFVRIE